jgi:hypothetical protein
MKTKKKKKKNQQAPRVEEGSQRPLGTCTHAHVPGIESEKKHKKTKPAALVSKAECLPWLQTCMLHAMPARVQLTAAGGVVMATRFSWEVAVQVDVHCGQFVHHLKYTCGESDEGFEFDIKLDSAHTIAEFREYNPPVWIGLGEIVSDLCSFANACGQCELAIELSITLPPPFRILLPCEGREESVDISVSFPDQENHTFLGKNRDWLLRGPVMTDSPDASVHYLALCEGGKQEQRALTGRQAVELVRSTALFRQAHDDPAESQTALEKLEGLLHEPPTKTAGCVIM